MEIYFDNAATTKVCPEAIEAMIRLMNEDYGNPSSAHYKGRHAAQELATARKNIADTLGAKPGEIYFTSGGTEADNQAVLGAAETFAHAGRHMIISAIEHEAVIQPAKKLERTGWEVTYLAPDGAGRITAEAFAEALRDDTVFASVLLVNNETGVINPVEEYSKEIKRRKLNTILHTDAVQGFCKLKFSVKTLGVDLLTVSAHKIHGPKGVGALYIKDGIKLSPVLFGGSQEGGKRAGTEALPAIVGFGKATGYVRGKMEETNAAVRKIYDFITQRVKADLPGAVIISDGKLPYILSLSLPGYKSEVLMNFLEGEGICVSKGAACKKGARSRVLEAMRLKNEIIDGTLRVSFSGFNTQEEAEYFVQALKKAASSLIKSRP